MVGFAALQLIPGSLISAFGNGRVVTQGGKGTGQAPALLFSILTEEIPWNSLEANHQEFRGVHTMQRSFKNSFLIQFISHFVTENQKQSSERESRGC